MKLSTKSIKNRIKSSWLDFNKKIQLVHELDFPDHSLYMCDNVRIGSCAKEPDTVNWIRTIKKDETVFDIGANVGAYSLVMSVFAKQVFAFEPAVMNFSLLCKNIMVNVQRSSIESNITPLNVALSDKTKFDTLNYVNLNLGKSGHQIHGRSIDGHGTPFRPVFGHLVMCFAIDTFVELFGLEAPNHIKMDVDGIEWEILRGAEKTLDDRRVKSLLVETDSQSEREKDIVEFLKRKRFTLSNQFLASHPNDHIYNYLFTR